MHRDFEEAGNQGGSLEKGSTMKRAFIGMMLLASGGLALTATAAEKKAPAASMQPAKPAQPAEAKPAEEKIVHTFKDENEIKEFAKVWQQRQATLVKMSVLKTYFTEEEATLAQLNNKLVNDYKVDTSKNYFLDAQRRALVERELPPPTAPAASAPASQTPEKKAP